MKQVATKRKNRTLRAAAVLFILVLLSTMFVGPLTARQTSGSYAEDSARTAAFVFRVQDEEGMFRIPVEINAPGEEVEYEFIVTNEDGTVCETDQEYTITLELEGSLPLVCTLTKNNSGTAEFSIDALSNPDAENALPKEASCSDTFEASVPAKDTYKLNIEWPAEASRKDPKYAGGVAEVEIDIVSLQID